MTTQPMPATAASPADRRGAVLALASVLLLLGSEVALTLPDETAQPDKVADFYTAHRTVVVVLQVVGFAAAGLLVGYCYRLRRRYPAVAAAGVLAGLLACVPGVVTVVTAVVADPAAPARAATWNARGPRADDVLFVGLIGLGTAVALVLAGRPVLRVLGALLVVLCVSRLGLEAAGHPRGALESLAPLCFIALVAALGAASARGRLPV